MMYDFHFFCFFGIYIISKNDIFFWLDFFLCKCHMAALQSTNPAFSSIRRKCLVHRANSLTSLKLRTYKLAMDDTKGKIVQVV